MSSDDICSAHASYPTLVSRKLSDKWFLAFLQCPVFKTAEEKSAEVFGNRRQTQIHQQNGSSIIIVKIRQ